MVGKKQESRDGPPGPPMRPKQASERRARRIWLTVVGRGGRSWDSWIADPQGNGITVKPPWNEHEEQFAVGQGEGAYDIAFDEEHKTRRLTVYEGMPLAPVYINKGNWKEVGDMAAEVRTYINNVALEMAAKIKHTEEPFPRWGLAMLIMAGMTTAVAIISTVMG